MLSLVAVLTFDSLAHALLVPAVFLGIATIEGQLVSPIIVGSGRPLIGDVSKSLRLDLLEAREYPSGNVMLRYSPRGA